jgi:GTP-binding protein
VGDLLDAAVRTGRALRKRITTADLNEELRAAIAANAPPVHRGREVRLYFATQADTGPPLIVVSANRGRCLPPAWERYLVRRIRTRWELRGVPVRLVVRGRGRGGQTPE